MEPDMNRVQHSQTEKRIIQISAEVANAVELLQKGKELTACLERILVTAQQELEEMYIGQDNPTAGALPCRQAESGTPYSE